MVDLTFLKQFTKDDSKKMKRYISLYLDVAPKTFEEMESNIKNADWQQLRINAHSLKPQADFMGISALKAALVHIEEAVTHNQLDGLEKIFLEAKKLSESSVHLLENQLEGL